MSSPFPGVDPYLEGSGLWSDFHPTFIGCWREALLDQLPEGYDARIGEHVNLIDVTEERVKEIYPDVAVITGEERGGSQRASHGVANLAPVMIPHLVEAEYREIYIEILRLRDQRLVSVLELLSPTNKAGSGRALYLDKRYRLLLQEVHLFELDLLLGGRRLPHAKPLPAGDFYAFVSRAENELDCEVYFWTLRDALPKLPIPLLAPDPDVVLDFAAIFAAAYERGRYRRAIAYDRRPDLRLRQDDAQWIASLIQPKNG